MNIKSKNLLVTAICNPLSTLVYSKTGVILIMIFIWATSILPSLPEAVILSAVSFLNNRDSFPCVVEDIFWDLSSCVPAWSNSADFAYTCIKIIFLYLLPLLFMVSVYSRIIKILWSKGVDGNSFMIYKL